ncbi:MAG: permease-like cell division protein FtsX [Candidatus Azobacteroides sp.]|nr:permease-like cell division protein FtsX [Candidatus Azobacteroides sp.]
MKNKRAISSATFINSRVTATISISLVLFLLGLIILLALMARNLSTYVKESLSFDVVLSDDIKDTEVSRIIKELNTTGFVKSTEYISKEAAAKQLEADIGQNPEEFLGFNPLPCLIVVRLHSDYAYPEKFPDIEKQIKSISPDINNIEYHKELMTMVNDNFRKIGAILSGLALLLLIISFALINNTIRLTVYANRFLIHTMKLVGATAGFIRKPFIVRQVLSGIIAALIAIALLFWGLFYISRNNGEIWEIIDNNALYIVAGSVSALGITISLCATFFAVNRYLRIEGDDLFFI